LARSTFCAYGKSPRRELAKEDRTAPLHLRTNNEEMVRAPKIEQGNRCPLGQNLNLQKRAQMQVHQLSTYFSPERADKKLQKSK
jgi:hypothetical protein